MEKGKFGICFGFYTVLAFILAFLGQTLLCGLLLGFVIFAERSEWLSKQVMQAFFLALLGSVISGALDIINIGQYVPFVNVFFTGIFGFITGCVSLVILIFSIIAIVRTSRGKDAGVPVLSGLANKAFGYVAQKVYTSADQAQK